jgi:hypothetical protein
LKQRTVEELYIEYTTPGTLLNHINETQPGWSIFLEAHGKKLINYPVALRWISEKYDELRPYIKLFPISTATFIMALLLRVLEKTEGSVIKMLLVAMAVPLLWLTYLHSRRANDITFYHIGMKFPDAAKDERSPLMDESTSSVGGV